ncbi:LPXTG-domain-containing protein [Colletotrichum graminicola M1.001]|uniref:LPXTG-domain-containing protein n=1 Tax=Colletotrichum graminicola (strain M1.001 / M2 / FGSC 10212) TaxID=645133 RepID=E3QPA4_COLGM|nr:LPXTG-domain-containing protein [Colletotrichum graminicola M1.001]EFQ32692.1 LPXTG-domain-containing protein [Colletotrichum graminicola M1.001]
MCCPPDYTLANSISGSIAGDCRSNILTGAIVTYASTSVTNTRDWTMVTTTVARPTYVGAIAIVGWTFDITASETASTSTLGLGETAAETTRPEQPNTTSVSPQGTTASEAFTTTTSPALATTAPPALSGLPLPTTIGVGVGAGAGVIILTALAFFLWRRKRKQQRRCEPPPADDFQPPMPVKPDKFSYVARHHELYGQQPERHMGAAEMPVPQYFAELDASGRERM